MLDKSRPSGLNCHDTGGHEEENKKAGGIVLLPLVHGLGANTQVLVDFLGLFLGAM